MSYFDWGDGLNHFKYANNASGSWLSETIPSPGDLGEDPSIALDSKKKAHISYDAGTSGLTYTTNASGSWVTETVDSSGSASSIALDSTDKAHISYQGSAGLTYATNASGSWVTETVDSSGSASSIALDSADKVHISYQGSAGLTYATNASGSWVTETVDVLFYCPGGSIAVDSSDKVHISYQSLFMSFPFIIEVVTYATNSSGSWVTKNFWDGCSFYTGGQPPSIAIDSSDKVHISHGIAWPSDPYLLELRHLTNASGVWVAEPVKWFFEVPIFYPFYREVFDTSIATDSWDNLHIGFIGNSDFESGLQYATNRLCFIASAAFGTEFVEKINVLRSFRDKYLLNNAEGKAFLKAYYKYSPPVADYIAQRGWLRAVVRILLLPVIGLVSLVV
jgi:hypothetical protein